jgi:hypothetical protein
MAEKTVLRPHPSRVAVAVLAALVIAWLLLSSPTLEVSDGTIECDPIQPLPFTILIPKDSSTRDAASDSKRPSTHADRSAELNPLEDTLLQQYECDMARERRQTMIIMTATGALALMLLLPACTRRRSIPTDLYRPDDLERDDWPDAFKRDEWLDDPEHPEHDG